jgi:hypothetical protein
MCVSLLTRLFAYRYVISRRVRRNLTAGLYMVACGVLAPWVVVLYLSQARTVRAHNLVLVSVVTGVVLAVAVLVTGMLWLYGSAWTSMAGSMTATLAFITTWFHLLTGIADSRRAATLAALVILVPVMLISAVIAYITGTRRGVVPRGNVAVYVLYLAAAVVLFVLAVRSGLMTEPVHAARHLRLVWTGLDCFELLGLALTARALLHRSPRIVLAASYTGTLLLSDAWFNDATSVGPAHLASIGMSLLEVPLAVLSLTLAARMVSSWPQADPFDCGIF